MSAVPRVSLRLREVAEQTGASLTVVKDWVSSGRLTSIQPNGKGGVILVRPADLEEFLDRHREGVNARPLQAVSSRRRTA